MNSKVDNIALRLDELINSVSEDILEEKERNFFLQSITSVDRTLSEMTFAEYRIDITHATINDKRKRLYNVIELATDDVVYHELILLLSAVKIVELLQSRASYSRVNHIANLDRFYQNAITDAYINELRMEQSANSTQKSVYSAKAANALDRAKQTRQLIENI